MLTLLMSVADGGVQVEWGPGHALAAMTLFVLLIGWVLSRVGKDLGPPPVDEEPPVDADDNK